MVSIHITWPCHFGPVAAQYIMGECVAEAYLSHSVWDAKSDRGRNQGLNIHLKGMPQWLDFYWAPPLICSTTCPNSTGWIQAFNRWVFEDSYPTQSRNFLHHSWLHEPVTWAIMYLIVPSMRRGLMLSLNSCYHHLEILNNVWTGLGI